MRIRVSPTAPGVGTMVGSRWAAAPLRTITKPADVEDDCWTDYDKVTGLWRTWEFGKRMRPKEDRIL